MCLFLGAFSPDHFPADRFAGGLALCLARVAQRRAGSLVRFSYRVFHLIRISNHKLNIETGRHDKNSRCDRIQCPVCGLNIEDEIHPLFNCPKYSSISDDFFNKIENRIPNYKHIPISTLIIQPMNSRDVGKKSLLRGGIEWSLRAFASMQARCVYFCEHQLWSNLPCEQRAP